MHRTLTRLILAAVALGLLSSTAVAQTATDTTTLAAAVADTSNQQVSLASVTAVAVGEILYVDGEAMLARAINSPYVTVSRGVQGSRAVPHNTGATVYVAPVAAVKPGRPPRGSCTRAAETYLPQIVPSLGEIWDCPSGAGVWVKLSGPEQAMTVTCRMLLIADMVDQSCFTADRPYYVTKITYVAKVAEAAGTLTVVPRRQQGTEAAASGDALATALNAVTSGIAAETVTTATLTTTTSLLILETGNRLGIDFTDDAAGELAGVTITFTLQPQ